MSALDKTLRELNDCGCCEGIAVSTPVDVRNRAGLERIDYRVGIHADFKQSLLARLAVAERPATQALTTRDDSDFTIALLDAFAVLGDILTFYQERIANEAYLRTATERMSVLEMARLLGYTLRPGVAADVCLAFTLDESAIAYGQPASPSAAVPLEPPPAVTIATGTKVQSIPAPGEEPQVFETVEDIDAHPEWNAIKPRLWERQVLHKSSTRVRLAGTEANVKPGDGILFPAGSAGTQVFFGVVTAVEVHTDFERPETDHTEVHIRTPLTPQAAPTDLVDVPDLSEIGEEYEEQIIDAADLAIEAEAEHFEIRDLLDNLRASPRVDSAVVFHTRAAIFGHNAPRWEHLPAIQRLQEPTFSTKEDGTVIIASLSDGPYQGRKETWAEMKLSGYIDHIEGDDWIDLDTTYPDIGPGSIVLRRGSECRVVNVTDVAELSLTDFTINAKVTRLTVDNTTGFEKFGIRRTTVYGQSERIPLARIPVENPVNPPASSPIRLDDWVDGLAAGQKIIWRGECDDAHGTYASEALEIGKVEHDLDRDGGTRITLVGRPAHAYVRSSVSINANVATATHGETVDEILGGGDATQAFQQFTLRQTPLTHVSASSPSGTETTLEVRVNDLLWREVPSFYGHKPEERIYVTRLDDDENTHVIFGDGKTGARLPTGESNITAHYRKGIGVGGLVKANQISQLLSRPLGVKEAVNPLASDGAADADKLDAARQNAPLTVLTLDRIVSLRDYEDFARAYAGIEKALATWSWSHQRRRVYVTVAGFDGAPVTAGTTLHDYLLEAMNKAGDPTVPLEVASYDPRFFTLGGSVQVHRDYIAANLEAEIEAVLRTTFAFTTREFGQPVHRSEVIAAIQRVPGVVSLNLTALHLSDEDPGEEPAKWLVAAVPGPRDEETFPAQLLTLDPRPLSLEVS